MNTDRSRRCGRRELWTGPLPGTPLRDSRGVPPDPRRGGDPDPFPVIILLEVFFAFGAAVGWFLEKWA